MTRGKVGIFAPSQVGDIITTTAVLKYRDQIWPNKDIVWFCDERYADALKFSSVEIRPWSTEDYLSMKVNSGVGDGMNRLDLNRVSQVSSISDLEVGYFPTPWMLEHPDQRHGIMYPQISQRIFGVDLSWSWRPFLSFSDDEREMVSSIMTALPYKRTVMFENSPCAYSEWNDNTTYTVMNNCRQKWGNVNFIFASGGHRSGNDMSRFFDDPGCISVSHLTARQVSLVNDYCDLFVGVGGALTFSTSCWGAKPTPKLIYTGSKIFGMSMIANGRIEIVAMDEHRHNKQAAENDFKIKLSTLLSEII